MPHGLLDQNDSPAVNSRLRRRTAPALLVDNQEEDEEEEKKASDEEAVNPDELEASSMSDRDSEYDSEDSQDSFPRRNQTKRAERRLTRTNANMRE
jgi:hypothetical protein